LIYTAKDQKTPFPAQSPDLNPIENFWGVLKLRLDARKPKNLQELRKFVDEEFYDMDYKYIHKLISSIPARLKAVIRGKGGSTKFQQLFHKGCFTNYDYLR